LDHNLIHDGDSTKALVAFSTALRVLGTLALSHTASADTAEATCEVRKDGEAKAGQSGTCTFSQRQSYVDISLRNGDSWSLTPGDGVNPYRDQKGNRVVRTVEGQDQVYHHKGHGKCVIVNQDADKKVASIDEGPGR
jgi:hypothetical protein